MTSQNVQDSSCHFQGHNLHPQVTDLRTQLAISSFPWGMHTIFFLNFYNLKRIVFTPNL